MRTFHQLPFSEQEVEMYRQQIFNNITTGMLFVLDALPDLDLTIADETEPLVATIQEIPDLKDAEPFPAQYRDPLRKLWEDPAIRMAWDRRNEAALPEKYAHSLDSSNTEPNRFLLNSLMYFYTDLDRLFDEAYRPTQKDILHCRVRTTGITETTLQLDDQRTMLVVDVGGQKSERRKWIHCFQDVTAILFLVNLSGYEQCLVEDKDVVRRGIARHGVAVIDSDWACRTRW